MPDDLQTLINDTPDDGTLDLGDGTTYEVGNDPTLASNRTQTGGTSRDGVLP